jgi:hypothetical protein
MVTIALSKDTKFRLDTFKRIPSESYNSLVNFLMDEYQKQKQDPKYL